MTRNRPSSARRATSAPVVQQSIATQPAASGGRALRRRLRDAGYKIGVSGLASAGAAYGSTQVKGPWHLSLIGLSCTFLAGVVAVVGDHPQFIVHPIKWVGRWRPRRPISGRSTQHPKFPEDQFLARLRKAQEVVIIDTIVFFLLEPKREEFLDALSKAINRGASVRITVLCPCSKALATRAQQLEVDPKGLKEQAERALVELDALRSELEAAGARGVLDVWLTTVLPVQSHYRCDKQILMSVLALGAPSQDGTQFQYSIDSTSRQAEEATLASLRNVGAALPRHMRGELNIVSASSRTRLLNVRYIMDDDTIYVALIEATDAAHASSLESGTWLHGSEKPKKVKQLVPVSDATDRYLHYALQRRAEDKYRDGASYVFYRVVV